MENQKEFKITTQQDITDQIIPGQNEESKQEKKPDQIEESKQEKKPDQIEESKQDKSQSNEFLQKYLQQCFAIIQQPLRKKEISWEKFNIKDQTPHSSKAYELLEYEAKKFSIKSNGQPKQYPLCTLAHTIKGQSVFSYYDKSYEEKYSQPCDCVCWIMEAYLYILKNNSTGKGSVMVQIDTNRVQVFDFIQQPNTKIYEIYDIGKKFGQYRCQGFLEKRIKYVVIPVFDKETRKEIVGVYVLRTKNPTNVISRMIHKFAKEKAEEQEQLKGLHETLRKKIQDMIISQWRPLMTEMMTWVFGYSCLIKSPQEYEPMSYSLPVKRNDSDFEQLRVLLPSTRGSPLALCSKQIYKSVIGKSYSYMIRIFKEAYEAKTTVVFKV